MEGGHPGSTRGRPSVWLAHLQFSLCTSSAIVISRQQQPSGKSRLPVTIGAQGEQPRASGSSTPAEVPGSEPTETQDHVLP